MLTMWTRDRTRGPKLPIETVVHKMTKNNADLYGFSDRGVVAPGLRADLNVARVEAIRGGSASTFASNSPGGVINMISDTGEREGGAGGPPPAAPRGPPRLDHPRTTRAPEAEASKVPRHTRRCPSRSAPPARGRSTPESSPAPLLNWPSSGTAR